MQTIIKVLCKPCVGHVTRALFCTLLNLERVLLRGTMMASVVLVDFWGSTHHQPCQLCEVKATITVSWNDTKRRSLRSCPGTGEKKLKVIPTSALFGIMHICSGISESPISYTHCHLFVDTVCCPCSFAPLRGHQPKFHCVSLCFCVLIMILACTQCLVCLFVILISVCNSTISLFLS